MSAPTPLVDRKVSFVDKDGQKFSCLFRDLDTLLYQWQSGTLPVEEGSSPGKVIGFRLGFSRPLEDIEVIGLADQCNKIRDECTAEMKAHFLKQVQTGQLKDTAPFPGGLSHEDVRAMLTPRIEHPPAQESVPVTQGLSDLDLLRVACMVAFVLRIGWPVEQWGLETLKNAGIAREDIEWAAQRIVETRPRR